MYHYGEVVDDIADRRLARVLALSHRPQKISLGYETDKVVIQVIHSERTYAHIAHQSCRVLECRRCANPDERMDTHRLILHRFLLAKILKPGCRKARPAAARALLRFARRTFALSKRRRDGMTGASSSIQA